MFYHRMSPTFPKSDGFYELPRGDGARIQVQDLRLCIGTDPSTRFPLIIILTLEQLESFISFHFILIEY